MTVCAITFTAAFVGMLLSLLKVDNLSLFPPNLTISLLEKKLKNTGKNVSKNTPKIIFSNTFFSKKTYCFSKNNFSRFFCWKCDGMYWGASPVPWRRFLNWQGSSRVHEWSYGWSKCAGIVALWEDRRRWVLRQRQEQRPALHSIRLLEMLQLEDSNHIIHEHLYSP